MSASNAEQSQKSAGQKRTLGQIQSLYEQCLSKERDLRENQPARHEDLRNRIVWELTFPGRKFPIAITADPGADTASLVREGQKYIALLDLLKKAPNGDTRSYWIAQWLKDEGVAPPHQTLPKGIFSRLTKKARERLKGLSLTDLLYANLVLVWLPYSEALLADAEILRQQGKDPAPQLIGLGYSIVAANCVVKRWRSVVEFSCEWLARRSGLPLAKPRLDANPARTLRNAYSRVYGSRRRSNSD